MNLHERKDPPTNVKERTLRIKVSESIDQETPTEILVKQYYELKQIQLEKRKTYRFKLDKRNGVYVMDTCLREPITEPEDETVEPWMTVYTPTKKEHVAIKYIAFTQIEDAEDFIRNAFYFITQQKENSVRFGLAVIVLLSVFIVFVWKKKRGKGK